jgi:Fe-Mn family superoxide dismutase
MPHSIKPLSFKPFRLQGLSHKLIDSHYENNYGGAVRRLNAIDQQLATLNPAVAPNFLLNGLKREQLIAANSAVLHEIYFDGLGGSGEIDDDVAAALERDFGSVDSWRAEFVAMGNALAGGSGWVLLCWSQHLDRLCNQWAADHTHCLAGGDILLALDMYEHAYHLDFGANASAYVDAFMRNVRWESVAARLRRARAGASAAPSAPALPSIAVEELQALLNRGERVAVVDARLAEDFEAAKDVLPSSRYIDPLRIGAAADSLPRDVPVAVYCVYGFQVSQDAVTALRARGIDARVVSGGIAAWRALGGKTGPKPNADDTGRGGQHS